MTHSMRGLIWYFVIAAAIALAMLTVTAFFEVAYGATVAPPDT